MVDIEDKCKKRNNCIKIALKGVKQKKQEKLELDSLGGRAPVEYL